MSARRSEASKSSGNSPYHHGNLREALIEAAIEILAEECIAGLGLRCAARAAGVSAAAPYHHFGSKEGEAHPELLVAAATSYQSIEDAITDLLEAQGEGALSIKLALNGGWALVHGLSTLLNEGKITPGELGNPEEEELVASIAEVWCRGVEQGLRGWSWPEGD